MPVKPSTIITNKTRGHRKPGARNVANRNVKYVMHSAGFIASVLQEFKEDVHITDAAGKILRSKKKSQNTFVKEWQDKTGV